MQRTRLSGARADPTGASPSAQTVNGSLTRALTAMAPGSPPAGAPHVRTSARGERRVELLPAVPAAGAQPRKPAHQGAVGGVALLADGTRRVAAAGRA